jgi:beta-1,4-N-acetylglucosaminyltransferase
MTLIQQYLPTPAIAAAAVAFLAVITLVLIIVSRFSQVDLLPLTCIQSVHTILSTSQHSTVPKTRRKGTPTHVLVVLGSGGHTAEMLSMLRRMPLDPNVYTFRTYIVTSGDGFSASKAAEFEATLETQHKNKSRDKDKESQNYEVITVPRARRVHQSYLTAPFSTIHCFWACLQVLRGQHAEQQASKRGGATSPYPDLILTNGPATAVCVVLGAKLLRFFTLPAASTKDSHKLRTIFIESWARVTTLSLSGKILLPFVDRFLVQWPKLEGKRAWRGMRKAEFVGTIIE